MCAFGSPFHHDVLLDARLDQIVGLVFHERRLIRSFGWTTSAYSFSRMRNSRNGSGVIGPCSLIVKRLSLHLNDDLALSLIARSPRASRRIMLGGRREGMLPG